MIMSHVFRISKLESSPEPIKFLGTLTALAMHPPTAMQVEVLKMLRVCARQSAACLGNAWPCGLVLPRMSSGQKARTNCQDKRSSRCVLVVSEGKRLSSLAEDGSARQVS